MPRQININYPPELNQAYHAFMPYCVGACCGYDAYDLNAARLDESVAADGVGWLLTALDQMDGVIGAVAGQRGHFQDGELFWSRKKECLDFYLRMRTEMLRALVAAAGAAAFDAVWLAHDGGTVAQVARAIEAGRSFGTAPVLADALEEAGCTNPELLGRLRATPPDARTSWAVALLVAGADGAFERPVVPTPD